MVELTPTFKILAMLLLVIWRSLTKTKYKIYMLLAREQLKKLLEIA